MIEDFRGRYRWLSNFYMAPVKFEGVMYPSSEHAYQAAKTLVPEKREWVREASTPSSAKRRGQVVPLRPGWDEMKSEVMLRIVQDKFRRNPGLAALLLATGEQPLVEGNVWHDNFFGDCSCFDCRTIEGQNWLGRCLVQVRSQLRNEP